MTSSLKAVPVAAAPPLERIVAQLMSDWSEDQWCAGWLVGLEHRLWEAIWGPGACADDSLEEIRAIAELTGAWAVWNDELGTAIVRLDDFAAAQRPDEAPSG